MIKALFARSSLSGMAMKGLFMKHGFPSTTTATMVKLKWKEMNELKNEILQNSLEHSQRFNCVMIVYLRLRVETSKLKSKSIRNKVGFTSWRVSV